MRNFWSRVSNLRLTGINIENFGPFANREIGGMSGKLTLLHGPSEGGKSANGRLRHGRRGVRTDDGATITLR